MEENEGAVAVKNGSARKKLIFALLLAALLGGVAFYIYIGYRSTNIATDDAYVTGDIYSIAPKINGTVKAVYVEDNTPVKKGQLLVDIEPQDYQVQVRQEDSGLQIERAKLTQTEAKVDAAKRRLSELIAGSEAARAQLELQHANRKQAESDANRAQELFKMGYVSRADYEKAVTALDVARAQELAA